MIFIAHETGMRGLVHTANHHDDLQRLAAPDVDGVFTDLPALAAG